MTTIIAEKPSVAREIANLVGAKEKKDGYLSGGGYFVTWAFGHLITLAMPQDYGFVGFKKENLPIIPAQHKLLPKQVYNGKEYKVDTGVSKQLKVIKELFNSSQQIIVATDAGREGELIFRYIYEYLNCKTPFKRLWISSLTDKAIAEGLKNLKPGDNYNNLYRSAKARSEADWLVGMNASQALTISAGKGVFSLGRVQTPTLGMICSRFLENKNFKSQKYWQIRLFSEKSNIPYSLLSENRFNSSEECNNAIKGIKGSNNAVISKYETKEVLQDPPLLYDLTTLQKESNSKLGFSADKTLSIAQKLYEGKLISYPRTGSRYISDDVFDEIPGLIKNLGRYPRFSGYIGNMPKELNNKSVNTSKVTDHHALIITENIPSNLSGDEKEIYELIAGRMLESFSPKCKKQVITITAESQGHLFTTKGTKVLHPGWRGVFNQQDENDEEINLPILSENETIQLLKVESLEKETKPKPLHTEASLLATMETAGKELENEEERQAIKECGIGTPATRAAIIETLFSREYIKREKKSLLPTEKGLAVYDIVKDKKISDVAMTGSWESELLKIENGSRDVHQFEQEIKQYTKEITGELLESNIKVSPEKKEICPKCKTGELVSYAKLVKCNSEQCDFKVWKTICGKELTDKQINDLVLKRKTGMIKGFKSKTGKSFDAILIMDSEFKIIFSFK